ncbi:MAG: C1 family peptidase, partial [Elusimicrobiota bacterium]|nr:C1 family peptidase [Elusimicrobiota bacterium]
MSINRRYIFQTAAVIALFCAAPASAQSISLSSAPLNPRFIEYRDKLKKVPAKSTTDSGHSLGFIPAPVDLSHDKGKKAPKSFRVKAYDPVYDLRPLGKVTPMRDQGSCGSCWVFSAVGAVESRLKTGETWDFSENNLKDTSGFDYAPCFGGQHFMALAYFSRWSGLWPETADPYSVVPNKQSASYPS